MSKKRGLNPVADLAEYTIYHLDEPVDIFDDYVRAEDWKGPEGLPAPLQPCDICHSQLTPEGVSGYQVIYVCTGCKMSLTFEP